MKKPLLIEEMKQCPTCGEIMREDDLLITIGDEKGVRLEFHIKKSLWNLFCKATEANGEDPLEIIECAYNDLNVRKELTKVKFHKIKKCTHFMSARFVNPGKKALDKGAKE